MMSFVTPMKWSESPTKRRRTRNTRTRCLEQDLVGPVRRLLRRMGYEHIVSEAQFVGYFVDLLAVRPDRQTSGQEEYAAVELKVASPSRAFKQAMRYQYIASWVFVAILENGTNTTARRYTESTGIGLIGVRADALGRMTARIIAPSLQSLVLQPGVAEAVWAAANKRPTG